MGDNVPDKNINVNGKTIGANSTIKLSAKTALWLLGSIVGIVMTILSWSYVKLNNKFEASKKEIQESRTEFINEVSDKVDKAAGEIQIIRIDQATIKGDIKLILDRQTRDNPVVANPNRSVETVTPPQQ